LPNGANIETDNAVIDSYPEFLDIASRNYNEHDWPG
jgi:hypothetical protein